MRRWVESLVGAARATTACLVPTPQFGDWLDPDAPPDRPWEAKADSDLLANAFFVHSARLAADAARAARATPTRAAGTTRSRDDGRRR